MDPATQFKLINELIVAIAKLLWPLITIIIILLFRNDLSAILKRLRKGKLFGQEIELDPYVEEFKKTVEQAQEEMVMLYNPCKNEMAWAIKELPPKP